MWHNVSRMRIFNGLRWNMLVLTRRVDESIRIGDDIRITVVKIKGTQQICVGVDAPRDVPVLREELLMGSAEVSDDAESSNS
jgi:carbon storage regulator